eukprot:TRINITY_DN11702_c0_g1_i70.p1 TRINITY_DN11702_c0_g1~~TRINITY_DN11702_c0_g1_i70.p1  ORF type:complete len:157 (+),score=25.75 TRINITY_DN11702_c0_g1_i70:542-1012(+)
MKTKSERRGYRGMDRRKLVEKLSLQLISDKDGGKGVTIKSVEGEDGREGMVQITCDPNAGIMDDIQCTSSNGRLDAYKATFRSSLACPLPDTLSGGSIFMIILLVLLVVYWVVGLLVNRFYFGETSFEVLPNLAFWTSLPGLVKVCTPSTNTFQRH